MSRFYRASRFGPVMAGVAILTLLAISLVSCSPAGELSMPISTPTFTPSAKAPPTPAAAPVTALTAAPIQISPTLAPASDILDLDQITSIPFGKARSSAFSLDDDYIYWVGPHEAYIFRVSIQGGAPEKLAASTYPGGRLDLWGLMVSGKWLIFADTNTRGEPDTWKIRVLNLQDRSERLVLDIRDDTTGLIDSFSMSVDGDRLVWTLGLPESDEDSISMLNLATGEQREILRTKEVGTSIWTLISLSKDQAILERDPDAGGTDIYLLDIATGNTQALSNDGQSNMPQFDFPWVVWKAGLRYDFANELAVYNLQERQKRRLFLTGMSNSDPSLNGRYIYWTGRTPNISKNRPGNTLYIFDPTKNTIYTLKSPGEEQRFDTVVIRGNLICWLRLTNASFAKSDSYLEWTTIQQDEK